jgi:hypothetical protein
MRLFALFVSFLLLVAPTAGEQVRLRISGTAALGDLASLPLLGDGVNDDGTFESFASFDGGFCPPTDSSNSDWYDTSPQGGFQIYPSTSPTEIFAVKSGPDAHHLIGRMNIPTIAYETSGASLPMATWASGGLFDPTEGLGPAVSAAIGGGANFGTNAMVFYGGRMFGVNQYFYDNRSGTIPAFWSRPINPLTTGDVDGLEAIGVDSGGAYAAFDIQRYHNILLNLVPDEWIEALGGPVFAGAGHSGSVESTQSWGASLFTFDPADVTFNSSRDDIMQPLVMYPPDHRELGLTSEWPPPSPYFSFAMGVEGGTAINGTRTFLFFGTDGDHESEYSCYGPGTATLALHGVDADGEPGGFTWCYDPSNVGASGGHMWPYVYKVWAYDMLDFAEVVAGTKTPWELRPYAMWTPTFPIYVNPAAANQLIYGGSYDSANKKLWIAQYPAGCPSGGGNGAFWRLSIDDTE